jgi:hypothetical protein
VTKEGEECDDFAVWHVGTRHVSPLMLNRKTIPLVWLNVRHAQPLLNAVPKTNGLPTIDQEVGRRFRGLLAKGHIPQFGHPRLCSRSVVHMRF